MFVITAFFAWNAQASDLSGAKAKELSSSILDESSLSFMATLCEKEAGVITIPNKKTCKTIINSAKMTQETFDYCQDQAKSGNFPFLSTFYTCVKNYAGRDYPHSYIAICQKVRDNNYGGIEASSPKVCLDYLSSTSAVFNSDAFELCLKANEGSMKYAKPCFNSIRDREIDTQKLERECFKNGKPNKDTLACIEKLTDSMPVAVNCSKSNRTASDASTTTSKTGTR
jgi:hypothetical protein